MSNRVIVMMMTSVMVMVIVMVMVMVSLVIHRAESHTCEHQFLTDIPQELQNVQYSGIGGIYAHIYIIVDMLKTQDESYPLIFQHMP